MTMKVFLARLYSTYCVTKLESEEPNVKLTSSQFSDEFHCLIQIRYKDAHQIKDEMIHNDLSYISIDP